jgi:hypothetical protein
MNEEALSKEGFAEKYKPKAAFEQDAHIFDRMFLSDLNALLREELILHAEHDWRRTFDKSDLVPALSWELNKERIINDIDEYLKSQQ